jgi:nucleoside-diphosphate-sugar epimerase
VTRGVAAVTGATGFLGQHLVRALSDDGWRVRVLARRAPVSPFWAGIEPEVVIGNLEDEAALARVCAGAGLVAHAAGLIAGSASQLRRVNVEGGRRLAVAAWKHAPGARTLLISSLAAREPQLSAYAASKRAGEEAALEVLGDAAVVVRPPAIYGPGDRETLRIFQAAARSPVLPVLDPRARIALIHVEDAARQIIALAQMQKSGCGPMGLCDERPEGYAWRELMQTVAAVLGRPRRLLRIPAGALSALAAVDMLGNGWRRRTATLTFGKVRELTHLDWGIQPHERAPGAPAAVFDLRAGFEHTVAWYRKSAWL